MNATTLVPTRSFPTAVVLTLGLVAMLAGPVSAAEPTALFGAGSFWSGFVDFWLGGLKRTNGVVLFVLGMGAVSLFIITRGKWLK